MAIAVAAEVVRQTRPGWTVRVIDADPSDSAYRGDAFVAIHADGSSNPSARGASVGYRTFEGARLGAAWKTAYTRRGFPGGFRPDNYTSNLSGYYGTRKAVSQNNRRAIIIEAGFLTNPSDRAWINANHAAIAASIWDAVAGPLEEEEEDVNHIIEVVVRPEKEAALLADINPLLRKHGVYADVLRLNESGAPYRAPINPSKLRTK